MFNVYRVVPSAYGTLLLGLALYKAAEYWKTTSGFKGFKLVKVLVLDQLLYFSLYELQFHCTKHADSLAQRRLLLHAQHSTGRDSIEQRVLVERS